MELSITSYTLILAQKSRCLSPTNWLSSRPSTPMAGFLRRKSKQPEARVSVKTNVEPTPSLPSTPLFARFATTSVAQDGPVGQHRMVSGPMVLGTAPARAESPKKSKASASTSSLALSPQNSPVLAPRPPSKYFPSVDKPLPPSNPGAPIDYLSESPPKSSLTGRSQAITRANGTATPNRHEKPLPPAIPSPPQGGPYQNQPSFRQSRSFPDPPSITSPQPAHSDPPGARNRLSFQSSYSRQNTSSSDIPVSSPSTSHSRNVQNSVPAGSKGSPNRLSFIGSSTSVDQTKLQNTVATNVRMASQSTSRSTNSQNPSLPSLKGPSTKRLSFIGSPSSHEPVLQAKQQNTSARDASIPSRSTSWRQNLEPTSSKGQTTNRLSFVGSPSSFDPAPEPKQLVVDASYDFNPWEEAKEATSPSYQASMSSFSGFFARAMRTDSIFPRYKASSNSSNKMCSGMRSSELEFQLLMRKCFCDVIVSIFDARSSIR